MKLMGSAGKPDATAISESPGLLQLRQPKQSSVKPPSLVLAPNRSGYLNVIQPDDPHPLTVSRVGMG
jgi:hypothetical protein